MVPPPIIAGTGAFPSPSTQQSQQNNGRPGNNGSPQSQSSHLLPHISTNQILQGLQASEEIIPVVAPQLSHVTPLISIGYAGRDIYSTFQHAYKKTERLPIQERVKKIAADTGDVTLFHLLSTFLIPLLLAKKVGGWLNPRVKDNPKLPKFMSRNPRLVTAAVLTGIAIALMNPMNTVVDFLLDHTYRPLVEKRKRDKLRREQEKLWKQYDKLKQQIPGVLYFSAANRVQSPFAIPSINNVKRVSSTAMQQF